ncbi:MAG: hypothetical protein NTV80_05525, partial [Verrucomicrobia bacterium]|nr:hypothetical protein [Verrucomicrobiota bacterium]
NRVPIKSKFGDEIVEYTRFIAEDFHPDRVSLSSSELGSYTISIPYGVQDSVKLIHWKNWKTNPQVNH